MALTPSKSPTKTETSKPQYLGMEDIWPAEEKTNREGKHIGEGKLMTDKQTDNPLMDSIPSAEGIKNK